MKPQLVYYVAASLDGYIARPDGAVDWLESIEASGEDHGYEAFYQNIDGLLMGRATYDMVRGFGIDWPYPASPVWSSRAIRWSSRRPTCRGVTVPRARPWMSWPRGAASESGWSAVAAWPATAWPPVCSTNS
jgi:hypothetical protein